MSVSEETWVSGMPFRPYKRFVAERFGIAEYHDHLQKAVLESNAEEQELARLGGRPAVLTSIRRHFPSFDPAEAQEPYGPAWATLKPILVACGLSPVDETTTLTDIKSFLDHVPAISVETSEVTMLDKPLAKTHGRVFIGHGRSNVWRDLKDFLHDRLRLDWDEFNREPAAGHSTKERLKAMLKNACFAFLVMTAEDESADGSKHARGNVIHELGLFQGRLGFERAIILLEDGCEEFSNITGLTQIRFPRGNIMAQSEEIRRVLEREEIL